jgi:adenylate cyclase class 2
MKIEIEMKIKVDSLGDTVAALDRCGGEFVGEFIERDLFFDGDEGHLLNKGCGLRLRRRTGGGVESNILTYKGKRQDGKYKARKEIEVEVDSLEDMILLLEELGYERKLEFEKRRKMWALGGCEVCLDELEPLGKFVEIEGPDEDAISKVAAELGLADREHINKGYAVMMSEIDDG